MGTTPESVAVGDSLRKQGFPVTARQQSIIDQLWRGDDIIISAAWYDDLAPILLAYLNHIWMQGGRVAVLTETSAQQQAMIAWLNQCLEQAGMFVHLRTAAAYENFAAAPIPPDIMVATVADLSKPSISEDCRQAGIQAMIISQACRTMGRHLGTVQAFLARLHEVLDKRVQYVILSSARYGLESALRRNITLDPNTRECTISSPAARKVFAILWTAEGQAWWQTPLLSGQLQTYLGAEPVLATLAWREGIQDILLVRQEQVPMLQFLQRIDNHLESLNAHPRLNHRLSGSAHEACQLPAGSWLCGSLQQGCLIVRDAEYNLGMALRRWQTRAADTELLLIVAPSYLLRDYLGYNAAYFSAGPLLALAPRIMKSRFAVALTLLTRLLVRALPEGDILTELKEIFPKASNAPDQLTVLFREVFAIEVLRSALLQRHRHHRFDTVAGKFVEEITLQLDSRVLEQPGLSFLHRYTIVDSHQTTLGDISADHLFQTYLPAQIHTVNGRPYWIIRADAATRILHVEHDDDFAGEVQYRPEVRITLTRVHEDLAYGGHTSQQRRAPWLIKLHLQEGDFTVCRPGYCLFMSGIDLQAAGHRYEPLSQEVAPPRSYRYGRLLTIELRRQDGGQVDNPARIAFTLAMLLNEAFCTLFPETHRFVYATTRLPEDFFSTPELPKLFPHLEYPAEEGNGDRLVRVVIVEDSQIDLGLMQCLFDDWQYVFMIIEDYLAWLLEEEPSPAREGWRHPDFDRQRFLKYGFPTIPVEFDLPGTLKLLRELGPYQVNTPCCQHRRQFYTQDASAAVATAANGAHRCDFCGGRLPSSEIERLQDGRERCLACKASAVDTVAELTQVFEEGREFLVQALGLTLRRGLQVSFADTQTLHRAAGSSFLPTHEYDPRTVGLAIRSGDSFQIIIENGQPYHLTLATIVHELTHIWQYDNLNIDRLQAEHGRLLVEGLAVWAELTCLESRNLGANYRQQQAARDDDYGQGYRLVLEFLAEPGQGENPFVLLRRLYPVSTRIS